MWLLCNAYFDFMCCLFVCLLLVVLEIRTKRLWLFLLVTGTWENDFSGYTKYK